MRLFLPWSGEPYKIGLGVRDRVPDTRELALQLFQWSMPAAKSSPRARILWAASGGDLLIWTDVASS